MNRRRNMGLIWMLVRNKLIKENKQNRITWTNQQSVYSNQLKQFNNQIQAELIKYPQI